MGSDRTALKQLQGMRALGGFALLLAALSLWPGSAARGATDNAADAAHPLALEPSQLRPEFWVDRLDEPDRIRMSAEQIAELNRRSFELDASMTVLEDLPSTLSAADVRRRIERVSATLPPSRYEANGTALSQKRRNWLASNLALNTLDTPVTPSFALVTRRAALRTYPTDLPLLSEPDDPDIDRLQESALFPGAAVAVLHTSRDRRWRFIVSERYSAWIAADALATGTRADVLGYGQREPSLTVMDRQVSTVVSPEAAALSGLLIDMGVRLPWRRDWPLDRPVNGQLPLAHWVVDLPTRGAKGQLQLQPALIAKTYRLVDTLPDYSAAAIIEQAFRFLGERYGWGHSNNARDCSGMVSETYRSLGIVLPRNTGDQANSPALEGVTLQVDLDHSQRQAHLQSLQVGDLVFVPGHVMLVIGRIDDVVWVIHDAYRVRVMRDQSLVTLPVNGVVVTPLQPLRAEDGAALSDRITRIVRVRPRAGGLVP